ncbi:MAG: response regulator [Litorilituus sp.]|jgi:putative two-component system response regulator|nr:response regulator [Litorilituus sp.]
MKNKSVNILIVDDKPDNIAILSKILKPFYQVVAALNGNKALEIANSDNKPDLILLDIMLPDLDGYQVCQRLKEQPNTRTIPVIFITSKDQSEDEEYGLQVGAVDFLTKPINQAIVKARIKTHLALNNQTKELERLVAIRTNQLQETQHKIIHILGRAAEYKDNETSLHVIRMSRYTKILAQAAGLGEEHVELLTNAAPMHDIGKIGIPDNILKKPGRLSEEEYKHMQNHSEIGAKIIGDDGSELLKLARTVAISHHEKWDGSGYPNGLSGESIPLEGRIVAIADVFDALTSERPYKKAWSVNEAITFLQEGAGNHFDPLLVPLFVNNLDKILMIKETYSE